MSRVTKTITDDLYQRCQQSLKQIGNSARVAIRLKAIISAKKNNIKQVSTIYGISRSTLHRWINNFDNQGINGLKVGLGRGRRSLINHQQETMIKNILLNNPTITAKELKEVIFKKFAIQIGMTSTYNLMHQLGFNYITARRKHYKQNKGDMNTFKKTPKSKLKQ